MHGLQNHTIWDKVAARWLLQIFPYADMPGACEIEFSILVLYSRGTVKT